LFSRILLLLLSPPDTTQLYQAANPFLRIPPKTEENNHFTERLEYFYLTSKI